MELDRFDLTAVSRGIGLAALVAVPVGLYAASLDSSSSALIPLSLVVFLALVAGAAAAAEGQRLGFPLAHGIVAAVGAVLVAQVFGIVRRLITGDDIRPGRIVSNILLGLIAGTIGGLIGSRRGER
jgi:hypothetical protein